MNKQDKSLREKVTDKFVEGVSTEAGKYTAKKILENYIIQVKPIVDFAATTVLGAGIGTGVSTGIAAGVSSFGLLERNSNPSKT